MQTRNERQVGMRAWRTRFSFLPLKEMKTRGAANGSLITGFPKAKVDSARRAWTVHRPSSCMVDQPPVARVWCFKKVSAGTKRNTWEGSQLSKQKKICYNSLFSFTNLCDMSNQWLPRAQSHRVLGCSTEVWRLHPSHPLGASQNWWVLMERSQACRDVYTFPFGKN